MSDHSKILLIYSLSGPTQAPIQLSTHFDSLIEAAPDNLPHYNFFGGPRDHMVSTPAKREQTQYATTELNNVHMSLDHNSLLYNVRFLNVFVPFVC